MLRLDMLAEPALPDNWPRRERSLAPAPKDRCWTYFRIGDRERAALVKRPGQSCAVWSGAGTAVGLERVMGIAPI